jgi:hypothetical protein
MQTILKERAGSTNFSSQDPWNSLVNFRDFWLTLTDKPKGGSETAIWTQQRGNRLVSKTLVTGKFRNRHHLVTFELQFQPHQGEPFIAVVSLKDLTGLKGPDKHDKNLTTGE